MTSPTPPTACPPPAVLRDLLDGDDPADAAHRSSAAHVEQCPACQAVLEQLTALDGVGQTPAAGHRSTATARPPADRPLSEGDLRRMSALLSTGGGGGGGRAALAPLPPAGRPDLPGYDLFGELGRGATGIVYAAHHHGLGRRVAVKVVRGDPSPEAAVRFRSEAQVIAGLHHPHVVQVYDVGTTRSGHPYIALELMAGGTLADAVAGRPAAAAVAAAVLETVARAVHHAHQRGVLHRDLKPSNVLLDGGDGGGDGGARLAVHPLAGRTPKVSDFGLAKPLGPDPGLTAVGQVVGTPHYLAPEQARPTAAGVTVATDVYALGATLYEVLTGGRPPFADAADQPPASAFDVLERVVHRTPVPPSRHLPRPVPRDLETICLKCLEKAPEARYPTAAALADDLRRFLDGRPIRGRPVSAAESARRWAVRRPLAAALIGALAVALVGGTGTSLYFAAHARRQARAAVAAQRTAESAAAAAAVAEAARARQSAGLLLDRGVALAEAGDPTAGLAWMVAALRASSDSDLQQVARVDLAAWADRSPHLEGWFDIPGHIVLSPDGRLAANFDTGPAPPGAGQSAGPLRLRFWDLSDGHPLGPAVTTPDVAVGPVAFSPDGRRLLTGNGLSQAYQGHPGWANVWDVATGRRLARLDGHANGIYSVAWSPDGHRFATGSSDSTVRVWSADALAAAGPPIPVLSAPFRLAVSGDGRWLLAVCAVGVQVCDLDRSAPAGPPLRPRGGEVVAAAFGPDGHALLVLTRDARGQSTRLATYAWDPAAGRTLGESRSIDCPGDAAAILPNGRPTAEPDFLGDGDRFARVSDGVQVWRAAPPPPAAAPPATRPAVVRPRGNQVGTALDSAGVRLWRLAGDGQSVEPVDPLTGNAIGPPLPRDAQERFRVAASSDGTRVALVVPRTPDRPIATLARLYDPRSGRPVGPPLQMLNTVTALAFSPDGRRLATGGHDHLVQLWDAADGHAVGPPLEQGQMVDRVRFAPDGRTLAVGTYGGQVRLWDPVTGTLRLPVLTLGEPVYDVAVSPAGDRVAGVGLRSAALWDARDGRRLTVLPFARPGPVVRGFLDPHALFDPDGRVLLTTNGFGTAYLWNAGDGHALSPPLVPPLVTGTAAAGDRVEATAFDFSPDGRLVVAAHEDGTAQLWDASLGRPLGPPWLVPGGVSDARFDPAGGVLLVTPRGVAIRCRLPEPLAGPVAGVARQVERWTGRSADAGGVIEPLTYRQWSALNLALP